MLPDENTDSKEDLGLSRDVFVSSRPDGESIVIGGASFFEGSPPASDGGKWARVLSRRAAHLLWYRLTLFLFPEKARHVTALVSTAPLQLNASPTVTTHVDVTQPEKDLYDVVGMMGKVSWTTRLSTLEARRLWTSLDLALYPDGWEEKDNKPESTTPQKEKPRRSRQTFQ
jgi:hypothetical protein